MVLNSLAEEKLQASLRVLAYHGHFLEIGKYDMAQNNALGKFLTNTIFVTLAVSCFLQYC